jgi:hypothetical protein
LLRAVVTVRKRSGKSSETAMMPAMADGTGEVHNAIGTAETAVIVTGTAGTGGSITEIGTAMTGEIPGIPISIDETSGNAGIIDKR